MTDFNTLTREQKTNILQDRLGFGNLQPLPQSLNSSKGAKFGNNWTSFKGKDVNEDYMQGLNDLQIRIQSQIDNQIEIFKDFNKLGM